MMLGKDFTSEFWNTSQTSLLKHHSQETQSISNDMISNVVSFGAIK